MSLTISRNRNVSSTRAAGDAAFSRARGRRVASGAAYVAGAAEQTDGVLGFSTDSRPAVSGLLNGLILPTEENVRKMSITLSKDLGSLLRRSGISAQPPIQFSLGAAGDIRIEGDRADKREILDAVNGDKRVMEEVRTTVAIGSHAAAMADSLKFEKDYMASDDPESVVAKYSYLFCSGRMSHHISLLFDGSGVNVLSDGMAWISSGTRP